MKISQETYYWYITIILTILVFVGKFFLDVKNSKQIDTIPKEYSAAAIPIRKEFNTQIIEELQKKKIVNIFDLQSVKPYTSIINGNSDSIKNSQNKSASASADFLDNEMVEPDNQATTSSEF